MPEPLQGEIWWADLPQPAGRRPVLILTRSDAIPQLSNITIAPLTRTIRDIDSEVILSPAHGVPSLCAISLENILTIQKRTLDKRVLRLDNDSMTAVFSAIRYAFAMPAQ